MYMYMYTHIHHSILRCYRSNDEVLCVVREGRASAITPSQAIILLEQAPNEKDVYHIIILFTCMYTCCTMYMLMTLVGFLTHLYTTAPVLKAGHPVSYSCLLVYMGWGFLGFLSLPFCLFVSVLYTYNSMYCTCTYV